jgi:hypothetical protein
MALGFTPTIREPLGLPGAFLLGVISFIGRLGPELPLPEREALGLATLVLGFGFVFVEGTLGLLPGLVVAGGLGAVLGAAGAVLDLTAGGLAFVVFGGFDLKILETLLGVTLVGGFFKFCI